MKCGTITRHNKSVPGGNMGKKWGGMPHCARFRGDNELQGGSAGPAIDLVPISVPNPF